MTSASGPSTLPRSMASEGRSTRLISLTNSSRLRHGCLPISMSGCTTSRNPFQKIFVESSSLSISAYSLPSRLRNWVLW
jgi:hypothetical protein